MFKKFQNYDFKNKAHIVYIITSINFKLNLCKLLLHEEIRKYNKKPNLVKLDHNNSKFNIFML